jgi:malonyl-CoA O-methyltransferase
LIKIKKRQKKIKQFNKHAKSYDDYSFIQKEVATYLASKIDKKYHTILDLGCGTGTVYNLIGKESKKYYAVDMSKNMCNIHPKDKKVETINQSFDDEKLFDKIPKCDIVISSSSIQWSKDLDKLFFNISKKTHNIAFAIFTSNTFKSLHEYLNISSPIYNKDEILDNLKKYFIFKYEIKKYKIDFNNTKELFQYLKKSGVNGDNRKLNFQQAKKLLTSYPHNFLEFEVMFVIGKTK